MVIIVRWLLAALLVLFVGFAVMYYRTFEAKFLKVLAVIVGLVNRNLGSRIGNVNRRVTREASISRSSFYYKVYAYFNTILVDLDMLKDGVTVAGFLFFNCALAVIVGVLLALMLQSFGFVVLTTSVSFYMIVSIFKFVSLLRYEKREAQIMDAVDLLVSDIRGGVQNAINRYMNSFRPIVKPYFREMIDSINENGLSFAAAMQNLNEHLGVNFTLFAQMAITYEAKSDDTMDTIFSPLIVSNRCKRMLRERNSITFANLQIQFIGACILIFLFGVFSIFTDKFMANFFLHTFAGKLLIVGDIFIIAFVLSKLAAIKAKLI